MKSVSNLGEENSPQKLLKASEEARHVVCEVIGHKGQERFSGKQFRFKCREFMGYPVKSGTLRTWRNRIGVSADNQDGKYSYEDWLVMLRFLCAKQAGKTVNEFLDIEYGET